MLKSLAVKNFAVIAELSLEFGPGLNALTGETGAGKSILLEALGFLLGGRGSSSWLRTGAARAPTANARSNRDRNVIQTSRGWNPDRQQPLRSQENMRQAR